MVDARRIMYATALVMLLVLLVGNYAPALSMFGVYIGTISLFGFSLEHEYAGIGLIIAVIFAGGGIDQRILLLLAVAGFFLFISDVVSMRSFTNPLGAALSVAIGFTLGWLTMRIARPMSREE